MVYSSVMVTTSSSSSSSTSLTLCRAATHASNPLSKTHHKSNRKLVAWRLHPISCVQNDHKQPSHKIPKNDILRVQLRPHDFCCLQGKLARHSSCLLLSKMSRMTPICFLVCDEIVQRQSWKFTLFSISSVQSLNWLGRQGDMRNNLADILFPSFLWKATVTNSGTGSLF